MNVIAAKVLCFGNALQPNFVCYQKQIINNARTMAQAFADCGYRIVSGGTDNHMFIIDLTDKGCNGRRAEQALEHAGIAVSRSCIPFDTQKPMLGSGIRIGTSAMTTRGMAESQALEIVALIDEVIQRRDEQSVLNSVKERVALLCKKFPLYT